MKRHLPPLNALRAFEAAGRLSSFSKAGEELNVSHTSISRHVRGLEARLGVQLFTSLPRGVKLTKAGSTYLAGISNALDLISDATDQLAPRQKNIVRLSCEPTFAVKWLMPALGEFKQLYPEIDLRIDASYNLVDLEQGEFELAIRFNSSTDRFIKSTGNNFEWDMISQQPMFPVGAPELFTDEIDPDDPKTILHLPFLPEYNHNRWSDWMQNAGLALDQQIKPEGGLKAALAIEAAIAGQGLALTSIDLAGNDMNAGRLVRFSNFELEYGAYRLVYPSKSLRSPSVRKFRDWLLQATGQLRELQTIV